MMNSLILQQPGTVYTDMNLKFTPGRWMKLYGCYKVYESLKHWIFCYELLCIYVITDLHYFNNTLTEPKMFPTNHRWTERGHVSQLFITLLYAEML